MTTRQVWLDIETGVLSSSWLKDRYDMTEQAIKSGYKLIEYSCPNDDDFEFGDLMKIATIIPHRGLNNESKTITPNLP